MATEGVRVFDSDRHVLEPPDLWERALDRRWRGRAPLGSRRTPLDLGVAVDGRDAFRFTPHAARLGLQSGAASSASPGSCPAVSTRAPSWTPWTGRGST